MTPGVDGQSQVGKSGAQIGPPDQVVAWADVRSLTANSLSNYAASCERNVSDLTAKVTDFVEQMDGISRKAVRPTGSWCVASQGAGLRFRQPTCWSARRILKTGPTRGPSHVSDTRYNPQNVSRDQLKSVGAPRRPDRPFRAAPAQRLRPDLEADVGDVAGTAAPAAVPSQRGTGRAAQFADLDALLDECVDVLDASAKPELYVMQSPIADAFTIGMGKPFTVITSGLYDLVTHDEMRFVMGHELGHALSGHAVYRTMMMHLLRLARSFGVLPVGGWALRAIVAALLEWQRKSELSGDRAGLLCAQDLDTALRVEMKLAGGCRLDKLDSEAFLAQAREYETSGDMRDGVLKLLNLELQTHPFSVLRAAALTHWVDTGGYAKVIAGEYPRRADDGNAKFADDLGAAARYYRDGFDQSNDPLIKGIRDGFGGIVEGVGRAASNAADSLGRKITEWRQPSK